MYLNGTPLMLSSKKEELLALLACEGGGPLTKRYVAEMLWADSPPLQALNNLYKLSVRIQAMKEKIPLRLDKNHISLNMDHIHCELEEFEILYKNRHEIQTCRQAIELYRGLLFYQNCYEWAGQWEAYYDLRYMELLECMALHYEKSGDKKTSEIYRSYMGNR